MGERFARVFKGSLDGKPIYGVTCITQDDELFVRECHSKEHAEGVRDAFLGHTPKEDTVEDQCSS